MKTKYTKAQIKKFLESVHDEVLNAHTHFQLHETIYRLIPAHRDVLNQASSFWQTVIDAAGDSFTMGLCRVYDQVGQGVHLKGCIEIIEANIDLFTDRIANLEDFKKQLRIDIESASDTDPTTKKLVDLRDFTFAHTNKSVVLGTRKFMVKWHEFEELAKRAHNILNRYFGILFDTERCLHFMPDGRGIQFVVDSMEHYYAFKKKQRGLP